MAKKSKIAKNEQRKAMVARYAERRQAVSYTHLTLPTSDLV